MKEKSGKIMLVVKNISKSLGNKPILQHLNFCLKQGEIIALLGPNGAGKTTLMRCMAGFYELDEGEILFNDKSLSYERKKVLQDMAYVPETGGLYPEMSVFEYLSFMAEIKHIDAEKFADNLVYLLKALELESVINQKCETLSKGYKRRVALAGALLSRPKVLILDEPTEGLDPQQKQHLRSFLKNYSRESIVLISTHIMEEVDALADRVLMLKDGKLICDTTPNDLKKVSPEGDIENSFCTIVGR